MTSWSELPLTEEHAAYLRDQAAITPEVAHAAGIRSASTVAELPEWAQFWGEQATPAIVFPWRTIHGEAIEQVRPDTEFEHDGQQYKYLFPKGSGAVLNALRHDPDAERVLIVEGTKQGLAAASWAPKGVAVYGVGGCRNWSSDGIPDADLEVCDGKQVFVCLDADVATNRDVYDAAVKLGTAARAEGAAGVSYVRLPAGGTNGLDDVLAKKAADRRSAFVDNLMNLAHRSKPCDAKPKPKDKRSANLASTRSALSSTGEERPVIYVDEDRRDVINEMTRVLLERWNATRLFCHGEVISQLVDEGNGPKMKPLVEGTFFDILSDAAATARKVLNADGEQVGMSHTWPDGQSVKATMSRASRFSRLDLIARAPFVREDGSLCLTNGYDPASRTMVVMDEALAHLDVPEHPAAEQVRAAVHLILDEWLGDFPFPDDANRANVLALVLTPFVRSMMDVVPLAVVDAHTPGTGKNLMVDCILMMFLGERPAVLPYNSDDDEFRKTLTAAFRDGAEVFVFDEAHHLDGVSLARALTASHWRDRQLGGNQMLGFPNRVTWIALGNNVRVEGDIFRRVYRVALRSSFEDPTLRPETDYRHPDLKEWTQRNRGSLLRAALTIVRSWFAAGQPKPSEPVPFGGFEKWAKTLGGIVENAGVTDFLGNLKTWRSESNFNQGYWESHLLWLQGQFGTSDFTSAAVRSKLVGTADPAYPPLHRQVDPEDKANYPKALGEAYAKIRDRGFGGLRLRRPLNQDGRPRKDSGGRSVFCIEETAPGGGPVEKEGPKGPFGPNQARTTETPETSQPFVCAKKNSFPVAGGAHDEKTFFVRAIEGTGGLRSLSGLSAPEKPWAELPVEQPSLFDESAVSVAAEPVDERRGPLPTPEVTRSAAPPSHWVDLYAADAPRLPRPHCGTCGTQKIPDAEMAYFLLCPICTPGSLRPADSEVPA